MGLSTGNLGKQCSRDSEHHHFLSNSPLQQHPIQSISSKHPAFGDRDMVIIDPIPDLTVYLSNFSIQRTLLQHHFATVDHLTHQQAQPASIHQPNHLHLKP
jgi:hypothetical protein